MDLFSRPKTAEQKALSVTQLLRRMKNLLEVQIGETWVEGEVSNLKKQASGHWYFSLKDEGAQISCAMFGARKRSGAEDLEDGVKVRVFAEASVYETRGQLQIIVQKAERAGMGDLQAKFEALKRKLQAEGLFDADRKKPIPFLPQTIGVITSPTGAVIRDILHRLNDRFPRHVLVWPVRVQGETAAAEVAAAIAGFNAMEHRPDLLIVARGGGSLEDLMPFNEEVVVRAAAASTIPLISAVGHETDTTLIDHAADWRAPTPTAAAERAVPVRADLLAEIASLAARQKRGLSRVFSEVRLRLQAAARALPKPDEILALARQRMDTAGAKLPRALRANLQTHALALARQSGRLNLKPLQQMTAESTRRLNDLSARRDRALKQLTQRKRESLMRETQVLAALSYKSVLQRGFAVLRDVQGVPLRGVASVKPDAALQVEMADGRLGVTATKPKVQGSLF